MAARLGARRDTIGGGREIEVDDSQVGAGYGLPTPASTEALELMARREGILLDPVYTAKAMAGLDRQAARRRVLFRRHRSLLAHGRAAGYFA